MSRPSRNPTSGLPSVVCQAKLDPFFSIPYTLFAIHNLPYPFCFETTASFLQETPRGGGCPNVPEIPSACVTPLESISFKIVSCKPLGISISSTNPPAFPRRNLPILPPCTHFFPAGCFSRFPHPVKQRRTNYRTIRIYMRERSGRPGSKESRGFGSADKANGGGQGMRGR